MKLKIYFGKSKLFLLSIVVLLAFAAIVVNALFLAGVGKLVTNVPVAAGISLGFSILILAFAATIFFNSNYQFGDDQLTSSISFFKDKIAYDTITDIKENSETKELYLIFKYKTDKVADRLSSVKILVKSEENQKVIDFLKEKNSSIIFANFVKDDDDSAKEETTDEKKKSKTDDKKKD
ncbi:MAG: hypothetical protein PHE93_04740 [Clostridia bacterium]|nr:hypothetical protein [Clostridia bacterium]